MSDFNSFADRTYFKASDMFVVHDPDDGLGKNVQAGKLLFVNPAGNVDHYPAPSAPGALIYHSIFNDENTNSNSGVNLRLVTKNVAGSGPAVVDIYKRKNGQFTISNGETDAAAFIGFDIAGTPHLRIGSNGNVGIGTTTPTYGLELVRAGEAAVCARSASGLARLFLLSGGSGGRSWSISAYNGIYGPSGGLAIADETAALVRLTVDTSGHLAPGGDNTQSNGRAGARWTTFYATTGTINTSDARDKVWLGPSAAGTVDQYLAAARRIEEELGSYQWATEMAAKGEDAARFHFGARAQRVVQIFIDEGLERSQSLDLPADQHIAPVDRPSFRHAFLCFDTWEEQREPIVEKRMVARKVEVFAPSGLTDRDGVPIASKAGKRFTTVMEERMVETGETRQTRAAGNRFGFRTDQLALFLAWANAVMRRELTARIEALEAKLSA